MMETQEENNTQEISASFGSYGKSFQEKILQALLIDHVWAEHLMEVFNENYFELKYLRFLASKYFQYWQKYKNFPTFSLLAAIIREDLKSHADANLRTQIVDYLTRIKANPDLGDLGFVKDKALDFCRKQALKAAMEKSIDKIATGDYESIVDIMRGAISVGTTPSVGHEFFQELEARFLPTRRDPIPTGMSELDAQHILNGGSGKGELLLVAAKSGVGKSHMLVNIGGNSLKRKKNVVHFSTELSEVLTGIRYDSHLTDIPVIDLIQRKQEVLDHYKENPYGRLFIKYAPARAMTVNMMRSYLERLSMKGFVPDLIVVDYADKLRSSRQLDSLRLELAWIYEELRNLATELQLPIWTASQINRDADDDLIDFSSMSESQDKAQIADFVMTIARRPIEKSTGSCRLFVAKNRMGVDGILFNAVVDTSRSKFKILKNATTEEEPKGDESEMKKRIRDKWNELQKSGVALGKVEASPSHQ